MMDYYLPYVLLTLLYAECTVGIVLNVFIVATNFHNWRTLRTLQTLDKILICLASSRSLFFVHMMVLDFLLLFYPPFLLDLLYSSVMLVGTMLLNHTNFWFASVLCVFYCVKITNYNSWFFILLKTRISSLVHCLLFVSLLVSVAFSLPCGWVVFRPDNQKFTHHLDQVDFMSGSFANTTLTHDTMFYDLQIRFLMFIVGSLPPFVTFCVAIFLLIQSLWVHISHMRRSGTGLGSPHLEVHFCAVKSMSLFLVLHAVYFVCMTIRLSPTSNIGILWRTLIIIIAGIPPFLHSLYIIISTKKLKETFLSWFYFR